ncbi:MAG: TRAP transporter substrate-binding protein [Microvirga sp.]|jgi:TRAP-type C4-dicarboxylate transport system substrate-binding protein
MRTTRRRFMAFAGAAVASPALLREGHAQAPQVTLKMHHFLPPVSNGHAKFLAPWARKVEADSQGRIKIDIFPSMQLGGTPPQLYDQARDGVADLVWTLPGSTPGRFPGIEVIELPFVAARRGVVNAKATQEFYETQAQLKQEFREVQPICLWAHDHGLVHANKQVKTIDDMKGLKLRSPTRQAAEALKMLGAAAVAMPIPQVPESLAQRVLDGCVVPWEVVPAIKVHELVKFHTEIPGSPTLYTATFILAMNKPKYESLPADLKAVIDKNSGQVAAEAAGRMWDEQAVIVSEMVKKRGNTITALSQDEATRWQQTTRPVIDNLNAALKDKNIDGAKLLESFQALVAKYDKTV